MRDICQSVDGIIQVLKPGAVSKVKLELLDQVHGKIDRGHCRNVNELVQVPHWVQLVHGDFKQNSSGVLA